MAHALQQTTKPKSFFQIKPHSSFQSEDRRCVFDDHAFPLESVRYISQVISMSRTHFRFVILLNEPVLSMSKEAFPTKTDYLMFDFDAKGEALKAQRELWRAWCEREEFDLLVDEKETESTV